MSVEFDALIDETLLRLGDEQGNYWTRDEIRRLLNRGQEEIVLRTQCLVDQAPFLLQENEDTYELPDDCLSIIRIESANGTPLTPKSSGDLPGLIRTSETTGNPKYYYSDLDGTNKVRFYPRPSTSQLAALVDFRSADWIPLADFPVTRMGYDGYYFYGVKGVYDSVIKYDRGFEVVWEADISSHNLTFPTVIVPQLHGVSGQGNVFLIDAGLCCSGKILMVDSAGSVSVTSPAHSPKNVIYPSPKSPKIFFTTTTGYMHSVLKTALTVADEGVSISEPQSSTKIFFDDSINQSTDKTYFVGTDGDIYSLSYAGVVASEVVGSYGEIIHVDSESAYVRNGTSIDLWTYSLSTTSPTTITSRNVAQLIAHSDGVIWFKDDAGYLVEVTTAGVENNRIYVGTSADYPASGAIAIRETLYTPGKYFGGEANHVGASIILDSDDVDSIEGEVTDISGDGIITFEDEEGVISHAVSQAEAMLIFYLKSPDLNEVHIPESVGMIYYAMFHSLLNDAERQDLVKAQIYRSEYQKVIGRINRRFAAVADPQSQKVRFF